MVVDWTINVSNLIAMLIVIGGAIKFFYHMRGDIRFLFDKLADVEKDLSKIESALEQIVKVFIELARQEERMSSMDRRQNDFAIRLLSLETKKQED